jgi:hypothetical protein
MLISLRLYIQGADLQPNEITRLLAIQPIRSHARGDARTLASGQVVTEKIGIWVWKTSANSEAASLSNCIQNLQQAFEHKAAKFSVLPNVDAIWVDVYIAEEYADNDEHARDAAFALTHQDIGILNKLALPVEFTVNISPGKV